jgi:hypothetical protein
MAAAMPHLLARPGRFEDRQRLVEFLRPRLVVYVLPRDRVLLPELVTTDADAEPRVGQAPTVMITSGGASRRAPRSICVSDESQPYSFVTIEGMRRSRARLLPLDAPGR